MKRIAKCESIEEFHRECSVRIEEGVTPEQIEEGLNYIGYLSDDEELVDDNGRLLGTVIEESDGGPGMWRLTDLEEIEEEEITPHNAVQVTDMKHI